MIELTAVEAVAAVRSGEMSAERYATALLDQAGRMKPLNAIIPPDSEQVPREARWRRPSCPKAGFRAAKRSAARPRIGGAGRLGPRRVDPAAESK